MIQGKAFWCKLLGEPVINKFTGEREWTIDVVLDKKAVKQLTDEGLAKKIKKNANGEPFIKFKKKEFFTQKDGTQKRAENIRIVGPDREEWDPKTKIGNGSVVNVKFKIKEYPSVGAAAYIQAVQVVNHIPYEDDFPEYNEAPTSTEPQVATGDSDDDWVDDEIV